MLPPACAKARGISPSTLLMTPGCRPEDICHCVSLEEERTGRPWAPPPPPQLGTPLSKGDQGRRAHLPLRAVLGQREFSKGRVHRLVLRAGQECGLLASRPWLLLHEASGETQESAFFNKCLEAFSCQMGGTVEALVPEPRAGGRGVAGQRPWRPVARLWGGAQPPCSGEEDAAGNAWTAQSVAGVRVCTRLCARACVHARVHLPAPVSSLLLSRFSENSSVHD